MNLSLNLAFVKTTTIFWIYIENWETSVTEAVSYTDIDKWSEIMIFESLLTTLKPAPFYKAAMAVV